MSEKEAFLRALQFAQTPFDGQSAKGKAARALFTILWLTDKNWHPEAIDIESKVAADEYMNAAFIDLDENDAASERLQHAACLLNNIFGWGLKADEWQATRGEPLVNELWEIINSEQLIK